MLVLSRLAVVLSTFFLASCIKRSSTYIENTGIEDLETSASGYSYQAKSGNPFNYKSFSSEAEGNPDEFDDSPESIGRYSHQPVPLHLLPLSPNFVPKSDPKYSESYGEMLAPYAQGFDNFQNHFADSNHYGQQSANFIKGGGSNYEDAERANRGEKGEKGYSNRDEFAKGLRGRHQNEQRKGFYDVLGGDKRGHQEQEGHYASKHQSANGNNGGSFSEEQSHDKGSKTTGFHKVYHKDEYKKDKTFYDKKDKKGHFNRYGNSHTKVGSDSGAVSNGKSVDSSYKQGNFGAQGHSDKGQFLEDASGYKGAEGDAKYYQNNAMYSNKAGKGSNENRGYSESNKFGNEADEK